MLGAALVAPRAASVCAAVAALTLALAGCATTTNSAVNLSSGRLDIYASQPPGDTGGQTATDVLDAEQLALRQIGSTIGKFTLRLIPLHGNELSDNARTAIQDQKAIAYLGEIEPGTSQISVEITNERGLHARASAKFVKLAATFDAEVTVSKEGATVDARSIMGLMMLAAGPGSQIVIHAEGAEAGAAVEALSELVTNRFEEDR